ncbi:MAG: DUF475 domain-containing protein [Proteobacteria bacterium]|nr:DUF475 domain-containing protein [Pseudomonadota bacterium]
MLGYLKGSILFAVICLAAACGFGWYQAHTVAGALAALWSVSILAVLEVSLSFDNAVVNATVLQDMDVVWRRRFLTWGMVIAVYGMFILFPLLIVAIAAKVSPIAAVHLSFSDPHRYETIISSAHIPIAGFGGAFLLMVGLKFFFDEDKEVHWIAAVERSLTRFSVLPSIEMAFVLLLVWAISLELPAAQAYGFIASAVLGIASFIAVDALGVALEAREERLKAAGALVRSGLGGFIYLNVLDASFSFDGVIGAFAISNNMVIIALGLSIGAMFVRSLTVMLVEKGTLAEFRFLEHGAFWAIVALGGTMLVSALVEIPEAFTGLIGAVSIFLSIVWSLRHRASDPVQVC